MGYQDPRTGRIDSFDPKPFGIGVKKGVNLSSID
jgi:hypothetical protein